MTGVWCTAAWQPGSGLEAHLGHHILKNKPCSCLYVLKIAKKLLVTAISSREDRGVIFFFFFFFLSHPSNTGEIYKKKIIPVLEGRPSVWPFMYFLGPLEVCTLQYSRSRIRVYMQIM